MLGFMSGRELCAAGLVAALMFVGCSGSGSDEITFSRADVTVPWEARVVRNHTIVRTTNGGIQDNYRLDSTVTYPMQMVGWRDNVSVHSLLVVPPHSRVVSSGALIERRADGKGNHLVLATAEAEDSPKPKVNVTWGDGLSQQFFVVPSPL
jgi:hypothetical protein